MEKANGRRVAARRCHDPDWLCEETGLCGSVLVGCRQLFCEPGRHAGADSGLDRKHCLRFANLLRFLRLYGHRYRCGTSLRLPLSGELPASLSRSEHHGILAPLAHDAIELVARLRLYLAW